MRRSIILLCFILIIVLVGCDRYQFLDEELWQETLGAVFNDEGDEEDPPPKSTSIEGLVGEWLFSNDLSDTSGYMNDAQLRDSASFGMDRWGNTNSSVYFDGLDDYVEIPDADQLDLTGDMTISMWVKGEDVGWINTVLLQKGQTGYAMESYNSGSIRNFKFRIDVDESGNTSDFDNDAWHFIVGSFHYSDEEFRVYVNNNLEKSMYEPVTGIFPNNDNIRIGISWQNTDDYQGYIDDVRIFNRLLNDTEMSTLYTLGGWTGPPPDYTKDSNVEGAWRMDGASMEDDRSGSGETLWESWSPFTDSGEKPPGYSGSSRSFDQTGDELYGSMAGSTDINGFDQEITICLWVKKNGSYPNDMVLIEKGDYTGDPVQYGVGYLSSNEIEFKFESQVVVSNGTLNPDDWHHIGIVYDDTKIMIYLNGSLDKSVSYSSGNSHQSMDFRIGSAWNDPTGSIAFYGWIDELILFSRALEDWEINDIMNNGMDGSNGGKDF